jgi:hypothetical protein
VGRRDETTKERRKRKKTHLHHPDGLSTSRSSPFPLDKLAPYSSNTEQPHTFATQTTDFLFSSLEVAVVQIEVGLREGGLVGEDEVRDEGGRLARVAGLGERERGRECLQEKEERSGMIAFRLEGKQRTLHATHPWCPPQTISSTSPLARPTASTPLSPLLPPKPSSLASKLGGVMARAATEEGLQSGKRHRWTGSPLRRRCCC